MKKDPKSATNAKPLLVSTIKEKENDQPDVEEVKTVIPSVPLNRNVLFPPPLLPSQEQVDTDNPMPP